MHSSKPSCRCGPRAASPAFGTAISAIRNVTFEPMAPDTGSSDVRPGRPSFFASDCFNNRAISPPSTHLPQLLDLARSALHRFELAVDLPRLLGDGVTDVVQHLVALVGGGVLRAAEPAGRRDRADVGQHRLVGAG